MATNDKMVDISGVVRAYEAMSKAYQSGRMGKREMECVMLNIRRFLEDCGVYQPAFIVSWHDSVDGRADNE